MGRSRRAAATEPARQRLLDYIHVTANCPGRAWRLRKTGELRRQGPTPAAPGARNRARGELRYPCQSQAETRIRASSGRAGCERFTARVRSAIVTSCGYQRRRIVAAWRGSAAGSVRTRRGRTVSKVDLAGTGRSRFDGSSEARARAPSVVSQPYRHEYRRSETALSGEPEWRSPGGPSEAGRSARRHY